MKAPSVIHISVSMEFIRLHHHALYIVGSLFSECQLQYLNWSNCHGSAYTSPQSQLTDEYYVTLSQGKRLKDKNKMQLWKKSLKIR